MSDQNDPGSVVEVGTSRPAYAQPIFIIEQGGRYYVTAAVLEYDPNASGITPEQRDGVAQIQKLYQSGQKGRVGVVEVARGIGIGQNTGPVHH